MRWLCCPTRARLAESARELGENHEAHSHHEVSGLGEAGDIVEVKDGYGRNYLLPRGLATGWTKGGQKQVDALTKGREVREIKDLDQAKGVKGQLEATSVKVPAKSASRPSLRCRQQR